MSSVEERPHDHGQQQAEARGTQHDQDRNDGRAIGDEPVELVEGHRADDRGQRALAERLHENKLDCGVVCEQAVDPALSDAWHEDSARLSRVSHGMDAAAILGPGGAFVADTRLHQPIVDLNLGLACVCGWIETPRDRDFYAHIRGGAE